MSDRSQGREPTIRDVAVEAGVSPMTVSRTLAGGVNVRPELQERVRRAVVDLGYRRNENARSLRPGQTSGLIGVAIANLSNPYYATFALGVEEIAAAHGRRIILGNTGDDLGRERQLVSDLLGRKVEGLVLVPSGGGTAHLSPARLGGVPLVLASRAVEGLDVDTVLLDDVAGAEAGTRLLLDAGHTRIGFLGNAASGFTSARRFAGFTAALASFGIAPTPDLIAHSSQDVESAEAATRVLLDLAVPPTAIFCTNNRNTVGALGEIGRRLRAGSDREPMPDLVGFDDVELAALMPVSVAIVSHDPRELGREAARLLFARLEGASGPARIVEQPVRAVGNG